MQSSSVSVAIGSKLIKSTTMGGEWVLVLACLRSGSAAGPDRPKAKGAPLEVAGAKVIAGDEAFAICVELIVGKEDAARGTTLARLRGGQKTPRTEVLEKGFMA